MAASAGNHAQGVAYAAAQLGLAATIVMPEWASISKQMATQNYGAEVILHGQDVSQAVEKARALEAEGYVFIHPYDDPEVMAGQGTLGLEILEDLPEVDAVVVPVGGGGLAAGLTLALKESKPEVLIIGVQTMQVPSLVEAFLRGAPTPVPAHSTLADGIRVPLIGKLPFAILQEHLRDLVLGGGAGNHPGPVIPAGRQEDPGGRGRGRDHRRLPVSPDRPARWAAGWCWW